MAYCDLTTEPLDAVAIQDRVRNGGYGAYVIFSGDVRDSDAGQRVSSLHYEAYEDLARKELARIAGEAEQRWPGTACAVVHRLGLLQVGESSIVIVVGAPHRADAFDACRWVIDTVKTTVPIWKREQYATGEEVWIEGDRQVPVAEV